MSRDETAPKTPRKRTGKLTVSLICHALSAGIRLARFPRV